MTNIEVNESILISLYTFYSDINLNINILKDRNNLPTTDLFIDENERRFEEKLYEIANNLIKEENIHIKKMKYSIFKNKLSLFFNIINKEKEKKQEPLKNMSLTEGFIDEINKALDFIEVDKKNILNLF